MRSEEVKRRVDLLANLGRVYNEGVYDIVWSMLRKRRTDRILDLSAIPQSPIFRLADRLGANIAFACPTDKKITVTGTEVVYQAVLIDEAINGRSTQDRISNHCLASTVEWRDRRTIPTDAKFDVVFGVLEDTSFVGGILLLEGEQIFELSHGRKFVVVFGINGNESALTTALHSNLDKLETFADWLGRDLEITKKLANDMIDLIQVRLRGKVINVRKEFSRLVRERFPDAYIGDLLSMNDEKPGAFLLLGFDPRLRTWQEMHFDDAILKLETERNRIRRIRSEDIEIEAAFGF